MERNLIGFVIVACVALLAVIAVHVSQGSSSGSKAARQQAASQKATLAPTTSNTSEVYAYLSSAQRTARYTTALQNFGEVVLQQAATRSSVWGPFDAYCSDSSADSSQPTGWTSQGHKPLSGQDCYVQHNPQYGGSSKLQLGANVLVGPNGSYTSHFDGAFINGVACSVLIAWNASKSPVVSIGKWPYQYPDDAKTASQAQALDNQAIACLNQTRP